MSSLCNSGALVQYITLDDLVVRHDVRLSKLVDVCSNPAEIESELLLHWYRIYRYILHPRNPLNRLFVSMHRNFMRQIMFPCKSGYRNWAAQPAEILQLICFSVSPMNQFYMRKALRLTCKAFSRKIRSLPMNYPRMFIHDGAVQLLELGASISYLLYYRPVVKTNVVSIIVQADRLDLMRPDFAFNDAAYRSIIFSGQVKYLRWIHQHGINLKSGSVYPYQNICECAIAYRKIECLTYAHQMGVPVNSQMAVRAASIGYLDGLRFLSEAGVKFSYEVTLEAVDKGHIDCFQYIYEKNKLLGPEICPLAAQRGHLDCLIFARQNGAPWGHATCRAAALEGNFECLQWAHSNGCPLDCIIGINPFYVNICQHAAGHGHLKCLQYCHENGIPLNKFVLLAAERSKNAECIAYVERYLGSSGLLAAERSYNADLMAYFKRSLGSSVC